MEVEYELEETLVKPRGIYLTIEYTTMQQESVIKSINGNVK